MFKRIRLTILALVAVASNPSAAENGCLWVMQGLCAQRANNVIGVCRQANQCYVNQNTSACEDGGTCDAAGEEEYIHCMWSNSVLCEPM